ncbi:MAG: bifunctional 23S rRNA (guanine(2069)-N(7))-methyltransferase RlmK/23S rRNA (guanine(2445)-N(2))-methyltransferase RlmL [Thermoleophilia bacterium]|jgi:23S rRNA (guanine2445-N2)-methyltransferase / 23S rRNA (guanine2069-N7)-methyltransferase
MTPCDRTLHHTFFATCPRNTEGLLFDELRSLDIPDARETRGGVSFGGPLTGAYRACLWSRVASRVLLRLSSAIVASIDELYEAVRALPWEDHVAATGTIAVEVTSTVRQGPLAQVNTHFVEQRAKDAVVDRFRDRTGERPSVDLARPDIRINIHLAPAEAIISLDLSGGGLHRRGYRPEGGEAPLKENLAAAILLRAGWPAIACENSPLIDPMCGSGTLLIEGALMAADIAPGLTRDYFGFLRWRGFEATTWQALLHEAKERRAHGLKRLPPIYGYDIERKAVSTTQANSRRAGLAGRLILERRPLAALSAPASITRGGLVVCNPPYGRRLGEVSELVPLYETLGEKLKASFAGWEASVLTGNPELGAHLGLRAHRVNVFYNGPILCKLLQFHVGVAFDRAADKTSNKAATALRAAGGAERSTDTGRPAKPQTAGLSAGAQMFANRLAKNTRHLRRWAAREGVYCYRIYDADLPEYSAAIDLYEDRLHIQEYAPPPTIDPVQARRRLKEMMVVAPETLGLPADHAVLKVRRPQRGTAQYERMGQAGPQMEVREGGLRFLVNLTDYLDTGLFLDHRPTRALIRDMAAGRRFLNLFAYTGTATVYAAAGGAVSTTTVDLSSTYLQWAQRNLQLNGLLGSQHSFAKADCLEWLQNAKAGTYDLIFLDAPTFSNSKSMIDTLDIQRDHGRLVRAAYRLLSPTGVLIFSSNFRRFRLDTDLSEEFAVEDITKRTIPPDFTRNPRIHTCFMIRPLSSRVSRPTAGKPRRRAERHMVRDTESDAAYDGRR